MPRGHRLRHAQEADEGADRDDNALGTIDPMRARPIEDEGAQSLGGIVVYVIAQSIKKSRKDPIVDIECRISKTTVFAHPRTELSQQRPKVTGRRRSCREPATLESGLAGSS